MMWVGDETFPCNASFLLVNQFAISRLSSVDEEQEEEEEEEEELVAMRCIVNRHSGIQFKVLSSREMERTS